MSSAPMPPGEAALTITTAQDPDPAHRTLLVRCPHGTTALALGGTVDATAERAATTPAVLQHYRATGCACTRAPPRTPPA